MVQIYVTIEPPTHTTEASAVATFAGGRDHDHQKPLERLRTVHMLSLTTGMFMRTLGYGTALKTDTVVVTAIRRVVIQGEAANFNGDLIAREGSSYASEAYSRFCCPQFCVFAPYGRVCTEIFDRLRAGGESVQREKLWRDGERHHQRHG